MFLCGFVECSRSGNRESWKTVTRRRRRRRTRTRRGGGEIEEMGSRGTYKKINKTDP